MERSRIALSMPSRGKVFWAWQSRDKTLESSIVKVVHDMVYIFIPTGFEIWGARSRPMCNSIRLDDHGNDDDDNGGYLVMRKESGRSVPSACLSSTCVSPSAARRLQRERPSTGMTISYPAGSRLFTQWKFMSLTSPHPYMLLSDLRQTQREADQGPGLEKGRQKQTDETWRIKK